MCTHQDESTSMQPWDPDAMVHGGVWMGQNKENLEMTTGQQ
jgi:hypothetical protein